MLATEYAKSKFSNIGTVSTLKLQSILFLRFTSVLAFGICYSLFPVE